MARWRWKSIPRAESCHISPCDPPQGRDMVTAHVLPLACHRAQLRAHHSEQSKMLLVPVQRDTPPHPVLLQTWIPCHRLSWCPVWACHIYDSTTGTPLQNLDHSWVPPPCSSAQGTATSLFLFPGKYQGALGGIYPAAANSKLLQPCSLRRPCCAWYSRHRYHMPWEMQFPQRTHRFCVSVMCSFWNHPTKIVFVEEMWTHSLKIGWQRFTTNNISECRAYTYVSLKSLERSVVPSCSATTTCQRSSTHITCVNAKYEV